MPFGMTRTDAFVFPASGWDSVFNVQRSATPSTPEPETKVASEPQAPSQTSSAVSYDGEAESPTIVVKPLVASSERSVSPPPKPPLRFWFDDGNVVLKVGNVLYNVYRGPFIQQSTYFRSKLAAAPVRSICSPKGKRKYEAGLYYEGLGSPTMPLTLEVKQSQFETLLSYMFPADYKALYELSTEKWVDILCVSTKLELSSIQAAAIYNIKKNADAFDLIRIGRECSISELYLEGSRLLSHRDASLTLEEGQRIGLAGVITIAHARDMLVKGTKWDELKLSLKFEEVL